ncbi:MAG: glycosyltransferase [Myxococcales bacterium]|nr:glycosyltransferase [Myxococcales bacterium]
MARRLRALVVSYAFPPVGGAGVQRSVKLVKYLPEAGVDAEVLSVANPSVPLQDHTFEEDLRGAVVHRARTLEPGYKVKQATWTTTAGSQARPSLKTRLLGKTVALARQLVVPDPQVLWVPGAAIELARIARGYDVVVITAPPFSQFLLGPLARLGGPAVVLDYRDEWSTLRQSYEMLKGGLNARVSGPLERELLRRADAIVAATPAFADNLRNEHPFLADRPVHAISNGFDPDDFPHDLPEPPRDRLQLTYAGTVYRLTSPRTFLSAVRKVHEREPELAKLLRLRFIGRIVDTELDAFEGMEALGVERLGYVPHGELMHHLSSSHYTLCIESDDPGVERIYPGKIFELMYLRRPVMSVAPEGVLTQLVRDLELGPIHRPDDVAGMTKTLVEALTSFRDADGVIPAIDTPEHDARIAPYHRRALAARWAEVLREAVAHRQG